MRYVPALALLVSVAAIADGGGASARPPVATAADATTFTLSTDIGLNSPCAPPDGARPGCHPVAWPEWTIDAPGGKASWDHCCDAGKWKSDYTFTPPPTLTTGGSAPLKLAISLAKCESMSGCGFGIGVRGDGVQDGAQSFNIRADFNQGASDSKSLPISLPASAASASAVHLVVALGDGPEITYTYKGSTTAAVRRLQRDLGRLGLYSGPFDGDDSPQLKAAVKSFQRRVGLRTDGDCEQRCRAALNKALGLDDPKLPPGAAPKAPRTVTQLQRDLRKLGLYSGPLDGDYDARTKAAVKRFQRDAGIPIDGKCTARCQFALVRALTRMATGRASRADYARSVFVATLK